MWTHVWLSNCMQKNTSFKTITLLCVWCVCVWCVWVCVCGYVCVCLCCVCTRCCRSWVIIGNISSFVFLKPSQFCVLHNCRKCSKHLIQQPALELLLDTITKLSPNTILSDEMENGLMSELFKILQDFLSIILKPVNDHLVMLDIKDASSVTVLKNNLV